MSDSDLLGRLLAGEQKAYRELVTRYQGAMRAVAYAIVGSRHADEVVQDAWLAVVRSLAGFQERSSLKTWLLTITANTAKTRLKHNRREVLLDDLAAPHGTVGDERFADDGHWLLAPHAWHQDSPEALLTEDELRQCLEHTLASLSELQASSSDYLDGQLTLRQRLAVRAHLAMCGNCRRFIRQMKLTQAVIRQMPDEELPELDALAERLAQNRRNQG